MTGSKAGVGVLLPLLLSLLLLALSNTVRADTSQDLINDGNWNGAVYGPDPGGCCASISGGGPLYDTTTDTIMFSYGRSILEQTIAINQALQLSGIEVNGYNYEWEWRRISNNRRGGDTLQFEVLVRDAAGNPVESHIYDYSYQGADDVWYSESGQQLFNQSYLDPQSVALRIIGQDGGYWAGYYGPEVRNIGLTLEYTVNPCGNDPLYDPSCPGYADALAKLLYDQQCAANPLYDSGCPGYAQAYFDQQCTADPLYNASCPGYANAYFDYQCSLDPLFDATCPGYANALYAYECSADPLYDTGCPGYAQAYLDQQCGFDPLYDTTCPGYQSAYYDLQCSIDTLYDSGCPGYAQAYFDQQCGLNPLYNTQCSGYAEAIVEKYVTPSETTNTETEISSTSEEITALTNIEEIGIPSATGDSTVDSILGDLNEVPIATFGVETEPVASVETQAETQETSQEAEASSEADSTTEELIADVETESDASEESDRSDDESSDESEGETSDGGDSKSEKQDSKKEKLKKMIAARAANLANDMAAAATLEAQQAAQAQVLALINYVPDFNTYSIMMNGGYLPDAAGYPDTQVPESRRGLRNGLAQQLLHEKMVEMQYENIRDR